jgi:pimeloyl-ACP methyl ester carboxylesterase
VFTNSTSAFSPRPEEGVAEDIVEQFESGGLTSIEQIPVHPKYAKRLPEEIKHRLLEDSQLLNPAAIGRGIAYTIPTVSIRDELHRNTRPALLICGTEEKRFSEYRNYVENNMPKTSLVDLPAGHAMNMECPDLFNDAIKEFLLQHD